MLMSPLYDISACTQSWSAGFKDSYLIQQINLHRKLLLNYVSLVGQLLKLNGLRSHHFLSELYDLLPYQGNKHIHLRYFILKVSLEAGYEQGVAT